jgi:hypothetical protein
MKRSHAEVVQDAAASGTDEIVAYFAARAGKRVTRREFTQQFGGRATTAAELCGHHNAALEYYKAVEQYWQAVAQAAHEAQEQQNAMLRGYLNERLGEQVDFLEVAEDFDGVWPLERVADMWQACQLHNQLAAVQSNEEEEQLDYRQYFDLSEFSSASNACCVCHSCVV